MRTPKAHDSETQQVKQFRVRPVECRRSLIMPTLCLKRRKLEVPVNLFCLLRWIASILALPNKGRVLHSQNDIKRLKIFHD
jgi:hypothetical protein